MKVAVAEQNLRPDFDGEMLDIARYVTDYNIDSQAAYDTARWCLIDALGCAVLALNYFECTKLLGPCLAGTVVPDGVPIPGTHYHLDPVTAAFNIGTLIRWLDFNDTWLAQEWGHPSDNLGAILACAAYRDQQALVNNSKRVLMRDVLTALIKAYEIQGIIALENSFNRLGLDHVILVKLASTALAIDILGGDKITLLNGLSQVFVDGHSLRTYRHAPNAGTRKSWAAGDATSRAVFLALLSLKGEMGYPSALSAKKWGFYDVYMAGAKLNFTRNYGSYVVENILFKVKYPAEFHAQTAVECAIQLHPQIANRLQEIDKIIISTHASAIRIINKAGPLHNPADRDHCLQYMTAIGLIFGDLTATHYEDEVACDPRIDQLREKMQVEENPQYSQDYLDPNKRSIANAVQVIFKDGSATQRLAIEYPLGHRQRRSESIPWLEKKFLANFATQFSAAKAAEIMILFKDPALLDSLPVLTFMDLLRP